MFSPITARSLKVQTLYLVIYLLLIVGGVTMVFPFLYTISGSMEPSTRVEGSFYPKYFFNDTQLWYRYQEVKYANNPDVLRATLSNSKENFFEGTIPRFSNKETALWLEFLKETRPDPNKFTAAFMGGAVAFGQVEFQQWLIRKYGDNLANINEALSTQFKKIISISPPNIYIIGTAAAKTPLMKKYYEFIAQLPLNRVIPLNVGGYYRAVYLPRTLGDNISSYNALYKTHYASWDDIPFPSKAPVEGRKDWFFFVSQVLRPDFVDLTESGVKAQAEAKVSKDEFIRVQAKPEDLRINSVDCLFTDWAAARGISDARIPQMAVDQQQFEQERGFWKWKFITLNYQMVINEVLLHGRAVVNTLILVALMLIGTLTVNPLAAYALSRFKLKQTYYILVFCLVTLAFPGEVTMIPVFLQMKEFHLLNTFGALILPGLASGFSVFLLKGFFDSLPKELYEAAELDGASEFTMFWQITMSLSKPILAVMALGAFTAAYGTFFYALILAPDPKMWTIMVYIYQLQQDATPPLVYASLIITAIPTLLIFVFCQNIILRGIVVPSDK